MNPYEVSIQNEAAYPVDAALLKRAAVEVLREHMPMGEYALTVVITDDAHVEALNTQFRGVHAPTDVLSFPADAPPVEIPGEPRYLGDLVIAYPYAALQAEREGHARDHSLALLVVHGVLHLLGYDHDDEAARAAMWAAQANVLKRLDIPLALVPQLENSLHDDET